MKTHHVKLGYPVPIVPMRAFGKLTRKELEAAWQIVGPTVDLNLSKLPLWEVIAADYCEGLHHGAETVRHNVI